MPSVDSAEWMPLFVLPPEKEYLTFYNALQTYGIDSRPVFMPIHLMNGFDIEYKAALTNSEKIYKTGFNLPSYPDLTIKQLKYICKCVNMVI